MTAYGEADFTRLKTVSIAQRANKVDTSVLAHPPGRDASFAAFWASLPDILAAKDLREVAHALARAASRRGVVVMLGGHVIKVGLGPLLRELVRRGVITHLALNGSAAIHDFELAAYGGTSEDVASGLADGTFGARAAAPGWVRRSPRRSSAARASPLPTYPCSSPRPSARSPSRCT